MDFAHGRESLSVDARVPFGDLCRATTHWVIRRYDEDATAYAHQKWLGNNPHWQSFELLGIRPYLVTEVVGNLITNAGWTRIMNLLTGQGGSPQALTATAVRIGVGDSNTAEAYGDTNLNGTNKWFEPVSGAATLGTRTMAFSASFGGSVANFAWNEFGLDVGTPTVSASATVNALLFNHKAGIAQGTKASGQVWTTTATVTFS